MAPKDQGLLAKLLYHFSEGMFRACMQIIAPWADMIIICMLIIVKNSSSHSGYILVEVIFYLCFSW
jgi:hypothetical protein